MKNELQIHIYPDPILRNKSVDIDMKNPETLKFLKEFEPLFIEAMIKHDGIGLSAPQIGKNINVIAIKLTSTSKAELFINPEITFASKKKVLFMEGCLSVPNIFGHVPRHEKIRLKYQNSDGKTIKRKFNIMESCVLQHEIDHLRGVLFIDKVVEYAPESEDKLKKLLKNSV